MNKRLTRVKMAQARRKSLAKADTGKGAAKAAPSSKSSAAPGEPAAKRRIRRYTLQFRNATEDIPRLISASGKNPCCCAAEFALVLRPGMVEGGEQPSGAMLVLKKKKGRGSKATTPPPAWWSSLVAGVAPVQADHGWDEVRYLPGGEDGAWRQLKALSRGLGKAGPVTFRGMWRGKISFPKGTKTPHIELRRKVGSYVEIEVESGAPGAEAGWAWMVRRLNKRWYTGAVADQPAEDSGQAWLLAEAMQQAYQAAVGIAGPACGVRDTQRRQAFDAEYAERRPVRMSKEPEQTRVQRLLARMAPEVEAQPPPGATSPAEDEPPTPRQPPAQAAVVQEVTDQAAQIVAEVGAHEAEPMLLDEVDVSSLEPGWRPKWLWAEAIPRQAPDGAEDQPDWEVVGEVLRTEIERLYDGARGEQVGEMWDEATRSPNPYAALVQLAGDAWGQLQAPYQGEPAMSPFRAQAGRDAVKAAVRRVLTVPDLLRRAHRLLRYAARAVASPLCQGRDREEAGALLQQALSAYAAAGKAAVAAKDSPKLGVAGVLRHIRQTAEAAALSAAKAGASCGGGQASLTALLKSAGGQATGPSPQPSPKDAADPLTEPDRKAVGDLSLPMISLGLRSLATEVEQLAYNRPVSRLAAAKLLGRVADQLEQEPDAVADRRKRWALQAQVGEVLHRIGAEHYPNQMKPVGAYVPTPNKLAMLHEYLDLGADRWRPDRIVVSHRHRVSASQWQDLATGLLHSDRLWDEQGGSGTTTDPRPGEDIGWRQLSEAEKDQWRRGAYRKVVAIDAPRLPTLYVDPQGYRYARYVAFPADGSVDEVKARYRAALRRLAEQDRQAAEGVASPAPAPVAAPPEPALGLGDPEIQVLPDVHHDAESAYLVEDYPYGRRARTQIRYWLESKKRGTRFVSQTRNPKTGRWNNPKRSTYDKEGMFLYLDGQGHLKSVALEGYLYGHGRAQELLERFGRKLPEGALRRVVARANAQVRWNRGRIDRLRQGDSGLRVNGEPVAVQEGDLERAERDLVGWEAVARAALSALPAVSAPAPEPPAPRRKPKPRAMSKPGSKPRPPATPTSTGALSQADKDAAIAQALMAGARDALASMLGGVP